MPAGPRWTLAQVEEPQTKPAERQTRTRSRSSSQGSSTRSATLLRLLSGKAGASLEELQAATGWQAHSVRGFLSGTVRRKMGLELTSEPDRSGTRRYRLASPLKKGNAVMRSRKSDEDFNHYLDSLDTLDRQVLVAEWTRSYGRPPFRQMSRDLLVRSLAHRLQEQRWGGLKPALARQLKQVAGGGKDARSITPAASRPKAGTRLIRQWHGTTHEVLVTDAGFEWKGESWKSLSRIAREITGQKWSGPVFFGLKARSGGSASQVELRELTAMSKTPVRHCAIYTRKSSEEGLEQEFNSLDAQREACAAYINSQRHEGWSEISSRYDDGGVSGGTLERPALARLMQDIEAGQVHIVVVYKIDRLTRSLFDFAKLVELFDRHGVSFVSVTQQFNTTTSMGRLTLNVLLSFAQFEREVTGERIRDKIAASRAKGMWMGGNPSLGYDIRDRRLGRQRRGSRDRSVTSSDGTWN